MLPIHLSEKRIGKIEDANAPTTFALQHFYYPTWKFLFLNFNVTNYENFKNGVSFVRSLSWHWLQCSSHQNSFLRYPYHIHPLTVSYRTSLEDLHLQIGEHLPYLPYTIHYRTPSYRIPPSHSIPYSPLPYLSGRSSPADRMASTVSPIQNKIPYPFLPYPHTVPRWKIFACRSEGSWE